MPLSCGVGGESWKSLGLQGEQTSQSYRKSTLNILLKTHAEGEAPIFWPPDAKSWLFRKDPDVGKNAGRRRRKQQRMNSWMATLIQWTVLDKRAIYSSSSLDQSCLTLCNPIDCSTPSFPVHHQLPRFYSNSGPLTWLHGWCHPTISSSVVPFSSCLQSFPASRFSSESVLRIRWPKYWSFSFNINPSNEHSGLISFRIEWLDLLAVQGTLKSLLEHHSSKASILECSAFFIVQLSHTTEHNWVLSTLTSPIKRWVQSP